MIRPNGRQSLTRMVATNQLAIYSSATIEAHCARDHVVSQARKE